MGVPSSVVRSAADLDDRGWSKGSWNQRTRFYLLFAQFYRVRLVCTHRPSIHYAQKILQNTRDGSFLLFRLLKDHILKEALVLNDTIREPAEVIGVRTCTIYASDELTEQSPSLRFQRNQSRARCCDQRPARSHHE